MKRFLAWWRKAWAAPRPFANQRETPSETALVNWLRGGR